MGRARIISSSTIIVAGLLAGCDPAARPTGPTAHEVGVSPDAPRYSDWSTPINLGPVINSASADIEVAITKNGLSLYFASNRPGGFGRQDIWVSRRADVDASWGAPENLGGEFNTAFDDRTPMVSHDGHRLYFSSDRPGGSGLTDIYLARRRDQRDDLAWGRIENLGPGVNTEFSENLPFVFEDERGKAVLYFNSSGRPDAIGATDIYLSVLQPDGTFGASSLVSELSSPQRDAGLAIRRDGLELILASDRIGTFGIFDLWVSNRSSTTEPWGTPVNLGPGVNSPGGEARLSLSFDATTLYIGADRAGGLGVQDLWVSTRTRVR